MLLSALSRQHHRSQLSRAVHITRLRGGVAFFSSLYERYSFKPPPSLSTPNPESPRKPNPESPKPTRITINIDDYCKNKKRDKQGHQNWAPLSLDDVMVMPTRSSDLPFDFQYSYTENSPSRPIGLREPKYSPFGPGLLDREWTGVCAPAMDPRPRSVDGDFGALEAEATLAEKRRKIREQLHGEKLSPAEQSHLVYNFKKLKTRRQINLGRDGLTHNMLTEIQSHWKYAEAVRIKCLGVSTVDMEKVVAQLEDKTFGKVIHRSRGLLILYRGRHYNHRTSPSIPLMLWRPHRPIYPRLIKTTIDGLSIQETKEIRRRGLAVPALTKLSKNGYYGNLVLMVRDAFLATDLVRIDCKGLEESDYRKIGLKLRELVPCILVTFKKEQVVVWRGKDYKPPEDASLFTDSESVDEVDMVSTHDFHVDDN